MIYPRIIKDTIITMIEQLNKFKNQLWQIDVIEFIMKQRGEILILSALSPSQLFLSLHYNLSLKTRNIMQRFVLDQSRFRIYHISSV